MPELSTLAVFVALLITPGPVVLYTVARSLEQGRRAGLASTVAVGFGDFCHVVAATARAVGVAGLLGDGVRDREVRGAAYLVYLGIRALLDRSASTDVAAPPAMPLRRVLSQGFVVALLNPKTSLFLLAFLPQFVDESRGVVASQILLLGAIFVVLGICTNTVYAFLAGSAGGLLRRNRQVLAKQRYFTGSVYIGLGLTTALASGPERH
jgi:threonine/homoserine/homoserine lactone efflux protein